MKIYTSRCGNTSGQECHAKGGRGGWRNNNIRYYVQR
jgi:hypothetical protein